MIKTLNLINLEKSDIKYKPIKYPDGQQQVLINPKDLTDYQVTKVQIKARLNNFLDLELITCAVASLRELEVEEIHLYAPYIMGARSDRKFDPDKDGFIGNNYVKSIIAPAINALNFKSVTCIDPHSNILEACLNNFKKESNLNLIEFAAQQLECFSGEKDKFILISPDEGAGKKIFKLAEQIGFKGDIITCSKERDVNGDLTKTVVPAYDTGPLIMKDYIIIDDICDGGATFINIAKELKKLYNCNHIYLIVTHGIFSKGFSELSKYFDNIYCTNSYSDLKENWTFGQNKLTMNLVKQLNVF